MYFREIGYLKHVKNGEHIKNWDGSNFTSLVE